MNCCSLHKGASNTGKSLEFRTYKTFSIPAIQRLFERTFTDAEGEAEGALVGRLVLSLINETAPQDISGFVAAEVDQPLGGIFFSRLSFEEPVEAFLLSPVAVRTDHQGRGIGQRLINFGLDRLRERGVKLVFTYGDPAFYSKVGFRQILEAEVCAPFEMTQPEGWLGQALDGGAIASLQGRPRCVKAFDKPEYW